LAFLQFRATALIVGEGGATHHVAAAILVQAVQARVAEWTGPVRIRERATAQIVRGAGRLCGPARVRGAALENLAVAAQWVRGARGHTAGIRATVAVLARRADRHGLPLGQVRGALFEFLTKALVRTRGHARGRDATRTGRVAQRSRSASLAILVARAVRFALLQNRAVAGKIVLPAR